MGDNKPGAPKKAVIFRSKKYLFVFVLLNALIAYLKYGLFQSDPTKFWIMFDIAYFVMFAFLFFEVSQPQNQERLLDVYILSLSLWLLFFMFTELGKSNFLIP